MSLRKLGEIVVEGPGRLEMEGQVVDGLSVRSDKRH